MSRKDDDPWVRVFDVTEPRKHKKGYTIYKVISKVFPKNSVEAVTQVIVWKRYNDFKKLHKALSTIHQNLHLKGTFPKFAEARFFGRFASDVIEERRKSALQLLEFAAQHSSLFTSQVFVKFFEDGQYIHPSENEELIQNKLLSPLKIHSNSVSQKSCINIIEEKKTTETRSLLGGIWEHCQTADDISLSSHPSDDDDRTTFTDEDSRLGTPLPSNDLALFDPLAEKNTEHLNSLEGESNSWLLSALQSCTYVHPDDQASSSPTLSFPKPFAELDYIEDSEYVEHILEDSSSQAIPDLQEFDPLLDSSTNIESKEDLSPKLELPSPLNAPENTYLFEAANLISQAHDFEAAGDFVSSFSYYRAAIGILLQGVQGDTNAVQREAVRRKTAQYLSRAEEIYGKYVVGHLKDENRWADDSRLSVASTIELNIGCLRGSYNELANYKVLGILGHVLLVLDSVTNSTFVVKSLYKRPDAKSFNSPNIVPQEIPFMVQLHKVYETDYAIFLVLQHASGGRLWDYVNSYLQHSPMSPCIDCGVPLTDYIMENKSNQHSCKNNVYTGKKLENLSETTDIKEVKDCVSSHISTDSDLETASTCPANYTALFTKYAASTAPDKGVLSKCHINFQKDNGMQNADDNPNVLNQSPTDKNESTSIILKKIIDKNNSSEIILNSKISEGSPKNVTYLQGEKDINLPDLLNDHMPYSSNDGIELLISNSKTLLYNVEETLKATSPTAKNINNVNNLITQDDILHYKNIISESNKDHQNNTVVNEEKYNLENKDNRKYKTQLKYSDNLLLTHQTEGLSSSVGSLTSQRIRHLSEVFQQLSTAASNQPYLPESCVRIWIAELIIALSYLHNLGLSWKDLRPDNILLGERGHILLTYQSSWNCMDQVINRHAKENLYSAPEVGGIFPITFACDWWSVGALMFELLTGRTLISCHPGGITAHSNINIPAHISMEARDLIVKLLKYNVSERLGSGPHGVEDIKSHPFFLEYDWNKIYN